MDIFLLRKKALEKQIPILSDSGLEFLHTLFLENNFKSFVEVGCAAATTSISLKLKFPYLKIFAIEKDFERFTLAKTNFDYFNFTDFHLIFDNALNVKLSQKVDVVFIDAAKAKYSQLFNYFRLYVNKGGIIVCDNLHFHGLVDNPSGSKNLIKMLAKLKAFREELKKYDTKFYDIGDGMSVTKL